VGGRCWLHNQGQALCCDRLLWTPVIWSGTRQVTCGIHVIHVIEDCAVAACMDTGWWGRVKGAFNHQMEQNGGGQGSQHTEDAHVPPCPRAKHSCSWGAL
jgi:hypothetical protein